MPGEHYGGGIMIETLFFIFIIVYCLYAFFVGRLFCRDIKFCGLSFRNYRIPARD